MGLINRNSLALVSCFITDHVRSTSEGNVFTRVCDSVQKGGRGQTPEPLPSPSKVGDPPSAR